MSAATSSPVARPPRSRGPLERFFALRESVATWQAVAWGLLGVGTFLGLWWLATRGTPASSGRPTNAGADEAVAAVGTADPPPRSFWDWMVWSGRPEDRWFPKTSNLDGPVETFAKLPSLLSMDASKGGRDLVGNLYVTLRRLALGFGLAAVVGIPIGILCGCFTRIDAFFAPITLFGRNIPIAALIPLTLSIFGIDEFQKVMFIFFACVAFIVFDVSRAVSDVGSQYVDTAYTLGANRWQIILKVLVPLAMPSVFNSLRLLFGLAFGYIMLAEVIKGAEGAGGIGHLINVSQRQGPREHVLLVLIIIPVVAFGIDRLLYWIQQETFPHRYGGAGSLNACVRAALHGWEDLKGMIVRPAQAPGADAAEGRKANS